MVSILATVTTLTASIPSPSSGNLGPLHMYGLMIALGVLAAIEVSRARWRARGGDPDDIYAIAFWAVPAGLIGARLYHLATDWRSYEGRWGDAVKIWEGGLGIPGGIALGVGVGVWVAYRRGLRISVGLDAIVPTLPLAQAIGRLGNWWNQELFGRPTDLPWAVEISPGRAAAAGYPGVTLFHPTFLYEMLWNLGLFAALVLIDRRRSLRPGTILPIYIGGYFLGRLWVEALRADTASTVAGLRINIWMSLLGIVGAIVIVAVRGWRRRPDDPDEPYRDGHRWSPPSADDVAEAPVPTVEDPAGTVGVDAEDGGVPTKDESVSEEPEEAPPPR